MSSVRFEVTIKQVWQDSYYDSDNGKKVEYERNEEIRGVYYDWEMVQVITSNILAGFKNATIEIKVVRED